MAYQATFKRYELKFMLTRQQQEAIMAVMAPHMAPDHYGMTTIRNLYYDTDSWRLIRRSIEKPIYKEKLRLRSYAQAGHDTPVFVELKKKYRDVVYKRRLSMEQDQALQWLFGGECPQAGQIGQEITYFRDFYETLRPKVFLCYDRVAWYATDGSDFRVTFDENILCRTDSLSLANDCWGSPLLEPDRILMEIKTGGAIPLWMTGFITQNRIFKTSFSKYGTAYQKYIYPGGFVYV